MLMSLFEKAYADYVTVYKVPIGKNQLDPTIFDFPDDGSEPKLHARIHAQISSDLEAITGNDQPFRVEEYYLVGPALIPGTKDRTGNLEVLIQLNNKIRDEDLESVRGESALKVANDLSNRVVEGSPLRKITYRIITRPIKQEQFPAIYNIRTHSWMKLPQNI